VLFQELEVDARELVEAVDIALLHQGEQVGQADVVLRDDDEVVSLVDVDEPITVGSRLVGVFHHEPCFLFVVALGRRFLLREIVTNLPICEVGYEVELDAVQLSDL